MSVGNWPEDGQKLVRCGSDVCQKFFRRVSSIHEQASGIYSVRDFQIYKGENNHTNVPRHQVYANVEVVETLSM